MQEAQLFSTELEPPPLHFLKRWWFADLLDLGTSVVFGWGALRALELERTAWDLVVASGVAWVLTSVVGGLSGWTLWRGVLGIRLRAEAFAPGLGRGLARVLTVPLDQLMTPVLQKRPLDMLLGLHAEAVPWGSRRWLRALGWQLPWGVLLAAAVYFLVAPTRQESLTFLKKLDGWRCCHARGPTTRWCTATVARAVREARKGDPQAQALVADCPVAAERMAR